MLEYCPLTLSLAVLLAVVALTFVRTEDDCRP